MNKNQSGFALIEGLLILLIVAVIGGVGYYVYNSQKQTDRSLNSASSVSDNDSSTKRSDNSSAKEKETEVMVNKNPGFVTISEWGVAAKIGSTDNSDKLTYRITKDEYGDDTAYFLLTDSVSTKCREVGLALHRKVGSDNSKYAKIGAASYAPSAALASMCDKQVGEEKAITLLNQLSTSINSYDYEFKVAN